MNIATSRTQKKDRRSWSAWNAAVATALVTLHIAAAAQPMSVGGSDKGIPAYVNPAVDLNAHAPGSGASWIDSIYITSQVRVNGRNYGLLVTTARLPNGAGTVSVAVTDQDTGRYEHHQAFVDTDNYSWEVGTLDIKAPGLRWTGNVKKMSIQASTSWGALDLELLPQGPALNYAGTGLWPMLGEDQYQFALPSMRTTGTLALDGRASRVVGESWLDRQWGALPSASPWRWTWMNISLSNGDKVAIWDIRDEKNENAFATVLHPDGSYELAAVRPLAEGADAIWTSPTSGNAYPTRWRVEIPALGAQLNVQITGTPAQEPTAGGVLPARMEATAAVTGLYQHKMVSGKTYVEMVGNWRP